MVEIVCFFCRSAASLKNMVKTKENKRKQIELQNKIAQITFGEKSW